MLQQWFKTVEEDEYNDEMLFFCNMIVVDVDFEEQSIHIRLDEGATLSV